MEEFLFDISEVCKILDTTSRTLRFYEEKGIISSTKRKFSTRRAYTKEQIDHIRNVMALRAIGLSVDTISKLQKNGTDLKSEIIAKRAEICAYINAKNKEISLLNEALAVIDDGKSIFENRFFEKLELPEEFDSIAEECAHAIAYGNTDVLYKYFTKRMTQYLPPSAYEAVRQDALSPLGELIAFEKPTRDTVYPNIVYLCVKYSRLRLKIKFVFHSEKIDGLWFDYLEN